MRGRIEQRLTRRILNQLAIAHDQHTVRQISDNADVVRNQGFDDVTAPNLANYRYDPASCY